MAIGMTIAFIIIPVALTIYFIMTRFSSTRMVESLTITALLLICLVLALPSPSSTTSSAMASQEKPTSIAMQVKIFSNPIANNADVRKQELENDFNKWMRDNWENISIDRIDTNSNSGYLHIVVLYKLKYK